MDIRQGGHFVFMNFQYMLYTCSTKSLGIYKFKRDGIQEKCICISSLISIGESSSPPTSSSRRLVSFGYITHSFWFTAKLCIEQIFSHNVRFNGKISIPEENTLWYTCNFLSEPIYSSCSYPSGKIKNIVVQLISLRYELPHFVQCRFILKQRSRFNNLLCPSVGLSVSNTLFCTYWIVY